jgi:hypothetical protein
MTVVYVVAGANLGPSQRVTTANIELTVLAAVRAKLEHIESIKSKRRRGGGAQGDKRSCRKTNTAHVKSSVKCFASGGSRTP